MLDNIILIFYYHIVKVTLFVSFVFIKLSLRIIWFQKAIFLKLATNNHLKLTKPLFSTLYISVVAINNYYYKSVDRNVVVWSYVLISMYDCTKQL